MDKLALITGAALFWAAWTDKTDDLKVGVTNMVTQPGFKGVAVITLGTMGVYTMYPKYNWVASSLATIMALSLFNKYSSGAEK